MKLKKFISSSLAVSMSVCTVFSQPISNISAEGIYEGFTYHENYYGNLVIDEYLGELTDIVIPSEIKGKTVTQINDNAFKGTESLKTITIPSTVGRIGEFFCADCPNLTDIIIEEENEKYYSSDGVLYSYNALLVCPEGKEGSYNIAEGTDYVHNRAFEYCNKLEEINVPSTVWRLGEFFCDGCDSLKAINVEEGNENYCSDDGVLYKFEKNWHYDYEKNDYVEAKGDTVLAVFPFAKGGSYTILDGAQRVGPAAFHDCEQLESVTISKSLRSFDDEYRELNAFSGCKNLKEILVDEENESYYSEDGVLFRKWIADIWDNENSKMIEREHKELVLCPQTMSGNYTVPEGVTMIQHNAFVNCYNIENIVLPSTLEYLNPKVFDGCSSLKNIEVDDKNETYYSYDGVVFSSVKSNNSPDSKEEKILNFCPQGRSGEYNIPGDTSGVSYYAFYNCSKIDAITIPDSVTYIGEYAFNGCSKIKSLDIPAGVTYLGCYFCENCPSLTEINVADGNEYYYSVDGALYKKRIDQIYNVTTDSDYYYPEYNVTTDSDYYYPEYNVTTDSDYYYPEYNVTTGTVYSIAVFPEGKDGYYEIADETDTIDSIAFENCSLISGVKIPESVKSIEENAFSNCSSLADVYIFNPDCRIANGGWRTGYTICNSTFSKSYGKNFDWWKPSFNGTIYGMMDSTAQEYAEKNEYNFKLLDDAPEIPPATTTVTESIEITTETTEAVVTELPEVTTEPANTEIQSTIVPQPAYTTTATNTNVESEEYTEISEGYLTFRVYKDYAEVYKCDEQAVGEVVIPSEINGLPVTEISVKAFDSCYYITCVIIPDSVTIIGDKAFDECFSLVTVKLSENITKIGARMFNECHCLQSISIPDGVISIGEGAFYRCYDLKEIILPKSVAFIEDCAFYYCEKLDSITFLNPYCSIYDEQGTIANYLNTNEFTDDFHGTIYGYENSTAQTYAEKYNRNFKVLDSEIMVTTTSTSIIKDTNITTTVTTLAEISPVITEPVETDYETGDVNGDGKVDASDASQILKVYALLSTSGVPEESEEQMEAADVNKDGKVDASDASYVLGYYAYLSTITGTPVPIEDFIS